VLVTIALSATVHGLTAGATLDHIRAAEPEPEPEPDPAR